MLLNTQNLKAVQSKSIMTFAIDFMQVIERFKISLFKQVPKWNGTLNLLSFLAASRIQQPVFLKSMCRVNIYIYISMYVLLRNLFKLIFTTFTAGFTIFIRFFDIFNIILNMSNLKTAFIVFISWVLQVFNHFYVHFCKCSCV